MKTYLLILATFFLWHSTFGQIKSGKVIYNLSYKVSQKRKESYKEIEDQRVREAVIKSNKEIEDTAPYLRTLLVFNTNEAIYKMEDAMTNDNGMDLDLTYGVATGNGGFSIPTSTRRWG